MSGYELSDRLSINYIAKKPKKTLKTVYWVSDYHTFTVYKCFIFFNCIFLIEPVWPTVHFANLASLVNVCLIHPCAKETRLACFYQ